MVKVHEIPDNGEAVEFSSLPMRIRALIRHLWESNPEICSPSGSTSDPNDAHDQIGQASLADQRVPDDSEDRESLEAERRTRNQAECENDNSADSDNERQNQLISSLPEQVPEETAAAPENNERQNQLVSFLPEQVPEDTVEAPETSEELRNRKDKGKATAYDDSEEHQLMAYEGNHTPVELDGAPDSDDESRRTISSWFAELINIRRCRHEENVNKVAKNKTNPNKKPKLSKRPKHRLMSDLLEQLKDEYVETPDEYVEVPVPKNKNKKNRKACKTNESPRFDEAGPSSHGVANHTRGTEPCGSGSVSGRLSMAEPSNQGPRTRSSRPSGSCLPMGRVERANSLQCEPNRMNSDIDINDPHVNEILRILLTMGEEMTQTRECNGLGECDGCELSGSLSEVVPASVVNGSRAEMEMELEMEMESETELEMETVQAEGSDSENMVCTLNQNPAEFSTDDE